MGRPARLWRLALGLLLTVVPVAPAQFGSPELGPVYLDLDTTATLHLQRAEASLADGQWAEGIDVLTQVMQTYGDKLVELAEGRHVNVRTLCQLKIAALPAEALGEYRRRVDGQAAAWYEQAVRQRRDPLLKRLVREFFCSSWGDDALWLLGERALEQGRYWEARSYWGRLLPADSSHWDHPNEPNQAESPPAGVLSYPDPGFDLGEVRARLVLCRVLAGDRAGAERELAELRRDHPDATGLLAGTEGNYVAILSGLLEESRSWASAPVDPDWPTFGGNARRNKMLPYTVELGAKVGSVELLAPQRRSRRRVRWPQPHIAEDVTQPLIYFPALVDGKLVVNNAGQLMVLDPSTCKPLWENSDAGGRRAPTNGSGGSSRHTLTVHGGRVYATTEGPSTNFRNNRARARRFGGGRFARALQYPGQSAIVCWSLEKEGEQLWEIRPPEPNLRFEGSPVVDEGRFYVALRREGPSAQVMVACYDDAQIVRVAGAPDEVRPPRLRWNRFVCQASTVNAASGRPSHSLLTLAGQHVYLCTNLGAIAALEAHDGTLEWVFTYERHGSRRMGDLPEHFARDLNPCLFYQGTLVAAPADTPEIFALDATTGRKRWSSELLPDAVHLLGVGAGNLIASGHGLYFLDMADGKVLRQFLHVDEPPARGYGRGILSGERVYWPTREEIWVFDQASGLPVRRLWLKPHGETGGNLLLADGYLVVAQPARLVVFAQYSRLFDGYEQAVAAKPDDGTLRYRLGRAAEALGRWELADASYRAAARLAQEDERIEGDSLATQAHERLYALHVERADAAAQAGDWSTAVQHEQRAAALPVAAPLRIEAMMRSARRWMEAERPEEALRGYQRVLADETLAAAPVRFSEQLVVPARPIVQRKIAEILRQHGAELYAEYDRLAQEQLAEAASQRGQRAAEELLDRFPSAALLRDTALEAARDALSQGRPQDAARLFRKLLPLAESDAQRVALLDGLAQAYTAAGFRPVSLAAYRSVDSSTDLVQTAVYQRAAEPQEDLLPIEADVTLPMLRKWQRTLPEGATFLQAEGIPPTTATRWLYVVVPGGLQCWSVADGTVQWQIATQHAVTWIGYAGDTLLVGTDADVTSVDLVDGRWNWRRSLRDDDGWTMAGPLLPRPDAQGRRFLIDKEQLYCRATKQVVALSFWTGELVWGVEGEGDEQLVDLMPDGTLLVHRSSENELLRMDADNGRFVSRLSVPDGDWRQPPQCLASGAVCIVPNRQTVELYDLSAGRRLWRFQEVSASGWPDVFSDGRDLLLVLLGRQELIRLDAESGSELWRHQMQIRHRGEPLRAMAFADEQGFYYVANGSLRAVALEDGRLLWQKHLALSEGRWRVAPAGDYLVAYSIDGVDSGGEAEIGASVVFCDRRTGRPIQRWNFVGAAGVETLVLDPQRAAVAQERQLWSFTPRHDLPTAPDGPDGP